MRKKRIIDIEKNVKSMLERIQYYFDVRRYELKDDPDQRIKELEYIAADLQLDYWDFLSSYEALKKDHNKYVRKYYELQGELNNVK